MQYSYFFEEAKMEYITKLGYASKAQGVLKRALKIQDHTIFLLIELKQIKTSFIPLK